MPGHTTLHGNVESGERCGTAPRCRSHRTCGRPESRRWAANPAARSACGTAQARPLEFEKNKRMPLWSLLIPIAAATLLGVGYLLHLGMLLAGACAAALIGAVIAAVHHAEVVAHRVGEPFGTLVLAIAITVIEVALIASMMLAGGPDKAALARDTIFSAIMIICIGVVGICLLLGGLRHREQSFRIEGVNSALANRLQTSLNLALGSALASGRTHMMQGAIHLVIFAAFLFLALVP